MENKKTELARKNMYMSQEIAKWYEEEAERLGVSQSNLMTFVLSNYIDQKKSVDMGETLKKLSDILDSNSDNKPKKA